MKTRHLLPLLASALIGAAAPAARADGGRLMPAAVPQAYTQECASCHTAYPPGLLPAVSWRRVMGGLGRHYGTDASLDPATVQQLSSWLAANAGTGRRGSEEPPQDRITRSAWFVREHRKVDAAVWAHASVKSAANCAACHTGADRGSYEEHQLQFPAGLDARYRRGWND
jgi:Dihaem cytochrome c